MVAVKSLWVLLKSFSTNFSFKRDNSVRVPDHKPDKRIRYNRLRPQWHRPYYPSADQEIGRGNGSTAGSPASSFNSSKSYQDYLNGNGGDDAENKFADRGGGGGEGTQVPNPNNYKKDFENFINSDSDYEDGDSDAEDFDDDFTTTDEDSDLDEDDDDGEEVLTCEVCDRAFPTIKKLADHQEKKRHYGCSHCDSIFPNRKALDFHREKADHLDFASDYGTDDTASYCSGSVVDGSSNGSTYGSGGGGGGSGSGRASICNGKCCNGGASSSAAAAAAAAAVEAAAPATASTTTGNNARYCSGRRNTNNNNYHCYGNQLHASWYEGEDEEEKGLLRN